MPQLQGVRVRWQFASSQKPDEGGKSVPNPSCTDTILGKVVLTTGFGRDLPRGSSVHPDSLTLSLTAGGTPSRPARGVREASRFATSADARAFRTEPS